MTMLEMIPLDPRIKIEDEEKYYEEFKSNLIDLFLNID